MTNSHLPSDALTQAPVADKGATPPSPLHNQAVSLFSSAPKALKPSTADFIASEERFAVASLASPAAEKFKAPEAVIKPQPSSPIQNGQLVFTDAFKQYSDAAKAAGDKAVFKNQVTA